MKPNQKLAPNTILHSVSCDQTRYEGDKIIIDSYLLRFQFYDLYYQIKVTKQAIDNNKKEISTCGNLTLLAIFEEMCKNEFWNIIKAKCNAYDKWYLKNEVNYEGEFNPRKKLVPLGESGQIFQNYRPRIIKTPFRKGFPEFGDFFYVHDQPLMRIGGSIYWYAIGDNRFDIRVMRKAGKFKKVVYAADTKPNGITPLSFVAFQLETIAQQQDLGDLMVHLLTPIIIDEPAYIPSYTSKIDLMKPF